MAAAGAKEGLQRIEENPSIKLVLCDVKMPDMDGLDFLKEMNRREWSQPVVSKYLIFIFSFLGSSHFPLSVCSGTKELNFVYKCLQEGAVDFLLKPITMNVCFSPSSLHCCPRGLTRDLVSVNHLEKYLGEE